MIVKCVVLKNKTREMQKCVSLFFKHTINKKYKNKMLKKRERSKYDETICVGDIVVLNKDLTQEKSKIINIDFHKEVIECFNYKVLSINEPVKKRYYGYNSVDSIDEKDKKLDSIVELVSNHILEEPIHLKKKIKLTAQLKDLIKYDI